MTSRRGRAVHLSRSSVVLVGALPPLLLLLGTAPAHAGDPLLLDLGGGAGTTTSLFSARDLPSSHELTRDVVLLNDAQQPGALRLQVVDLVDEENGCSRDEAALDGTCGPGGGELSASTVLTVERDGATLYRGDLRTAAASVAAGTLDAGGRAEVRVRLGWADLDDRAQTDGLSLGLRWTLSGTGSANGGTDGGTDGGAAPEPQGGFGEGGEGGEGVLSTPPTADPATATPGERGLALPRTGSDVGPLALLGLLLVAAGAAATAVRRPTGRHRVHRS